MPLVLAAIGAKFFHFQPLRGRAFILCLAVISVFALVALELNNFTRHFLNLLVVSRG
jgi:hypothetical protein